MEHLPTELVYHMAFCSSEAHIIWPSIRAVCKGLHAGPWTPGQIAMVSHARLTAIQRQIRKRRCVVPGCQASRISRMLWGGRGIPYESCMPYCAVHMDSAGRGHRMDVLYLGEV